MTFLTAFQSAKHDIKCAFHSQKKCLFWSWL